jgi:peptide/nickel transport system permease protein
MGLFFLRRLGVMLLTALCLTFVVFFLTNLYPNLEKLAKTQGNFRMSEEAVASWLGDRGYLQSTPKKYGEWLGVVPSFRHVEENGKVRSRCIPPGSNDTSVSDYCGLLQGYWGYSTQFKRTAAEIMGKRLGLTAYLMMWVLLLTIPFALMIGILAGMREGSPTDRTLSSFSILTSATPEYVSGVVLIVVFTSSAVGLKWFKGSAASAMENPGFENLLLPVLTISMFSIGYIARMTRASMAEVMTAQYIRTARLKGVSFPKIVMRHALRNALIAPFTVIVLQIPYLLTGVVITETLFNYKGFGWLLVQAAGNNDIEMLLGVSVVSVVIVLVTQLISDVGYVYLNPRIRIS